MSTKPVTKQPCVKEKTIFYSQREYNDFALLINALWYNHSFAQMCVLSGDMAHGPLVNVPKQKIILKVITHISLNKFFIIHKIYVVYQKNTETDPKWL